MSKYIIKEIKKFKERHPDKIMWQRVGDYYESYMDDAEVCAKVLEIKLSHSKDGMAMIGFPCHMLDAYLPKMIQAGYKLAICESLIKANRSAT